jgi:GNAT superfamily N-acetyltransferase
MELPAGLGQRPLTLRDAAAVAALIAAQELHDVGEVMIEEADVVADWQRPSYDVQAGTVGVFDGEALVAFAELSSPDRGFVAVHPDHRGRGLGTALAGWTQRRARGRGSTVVGTPVPTGSPGERLLTQLGYRPRWTSWVLQLPAGREIEPQPLPVGHSIRAAESASDRRAVWTLLEDAFLEWSTRPRQSYEDFAAQVWLRPGFEPWQLRILVDGAGEPVAAAFLVMAGDCGYVDRIATRRDRRNQGLARALLADVFRESRVHGATRSELSTDSRTGALGLYEKVGMEVTSTWVNLAKEV